MAFQLLRTNISLTGNVKLCGFIEDGEISKAELHPISSILPIYPHSINIHNSKYGYDLVKFYKDYKDVFYSPLIDDKYLDNSEFRKLTSNDEYFNGNIGDGQYGLKRVSKQKNGKQLSIFAPIFVENAKEIPHYIKFSFYVAGKDTPFFDRIISIGPETLFGKYIKRSFEELNDGDDDCHIININPASDTSVVYGISTESGGYVKCTSNLPKVLYNRDLTYTEFNNRICDEFRTYSIVDAHIINFCWYFDFDEFFKTNILKVDYGKEFNINVEYLDSNKQPLQLVDLDFNLYDIEATIGDKKLNLLDYLHEPQIPDFRDNVMEHLVPTINKWSICESNNTYLFNNYIGFDVQDLKVGDCVYTFDSNVSTPKSILNNMVWLNYLLQGLSTGEVKLLKPDATNNIFINPGYAINGPSERDDIIRLLYNKHKELFKSCKIYKDVIVYNGIKFKIELKNELEKLKISDDISKLSFSLIDTAGIKSNEKSLLIIHDNDTLHYLIYINRDLEGDKYSCDDSQLTIAGLKDIEFDNVYFTKAERVDVAWDYKEVTGYKFNIISFDESTDAKYTLINRQIYSILQNDTDRTDSVLYKENGVSNSYIKRYSGWIQPAFIEIDSKEGTAKKNEFIFLKKIYDNDRKVGEGTWGTTSIIPLYNTEEYSINKYMFDDISIEGKWFRASRVIHLPSSYEIQVDIYDSNGKKSDVTTNDIFEIFFKEIGITSEKGKYVGNMYNVSYDVNDEGDKYIIRLNII